MSEEATIFYSWQSDRGETRFFVRDALQNALNSLTLVEPARFDSDTAGVAGTPAIAETIFRKIDQAAVFVADLTFVGQADAPTGEGDADGPSSAQRKRVPNPNVLAELGYAVARLGWDRIILVLNEHFGPAADLPFDLRNRRFPLRFTLAPGASEKGTLQTQVSKTLQDYVNASLASELASAEDAMTSLDHYAVEMLLTQAADGEPWGINMTFGSMATISPPDFAIRRLLELRLARTQFTPDSTIRRYELTYLGRQVVQILLARGARSIQDRR
jgi:hypothetical protein